MRENIRIDDPNLWEAVSHVDVVKLNVKSQNSLNRNEKVCIVLVNAQRFEIFTIFTKFEIRTCKRTELHSLKNSCHKILYNAVHFPIYSYDMFRTDFGRKNVMG